MKKNSKWLLYYLLSDNVRIIFERSVNKNKRYRRQQKTSEGYKKYQLWQDFLLQPRMKSTSLLQIPKIRTPVELDNVLQLFYAEMKKIFYNLKEMKKYYKQYVIYFDTQR